MIQAIVSFLVFVVVLSGIGFGVSWLVDNESELSKSDAKSITELPVQQGEEKESQEETREEEDKIEKERIEEVADEDSIDPTSVEVIVLNGGAEVGAAGELAQALKKEGFSQVKSGNASDYTYKNVSIYYQEERSLAEYMANLLPTLGVSGEISIMEAVDVDHKNAEVTVILGE